jgi:hypothetical protein
MEMGGKTGNRGDGLLGGLVAVPCHHSSSQTEPRTDSTHHGILGSWLRSESMVGSAHWRCSTEKKSYSKGMTEIENSRTTNQIGMEAEDRQGSLSYSSSQVGWP